MHDCSLCNVLSAALACLSPEFQLCRPPATLCLFMRFALCKLASTTTCESLMHTWQCSLAWVRKLRMVDLQHAKRTVEPERDACNLCCHSFGPEARAADSGVAAAANLPIRDRPPACAKVRHSLCDAADEVIGLNAGLAVADVHSWQAMK